MSDATCRTLFNRARMRRLADLACLHEPVHVADLDSSAARARLASVEVLVTGWGCPPLTEQLLRGAPALRAVLHAGGTVKGHVSEACWQRGIAVSSAVEANAVPTAEYALAAILFAGKRAHRYASLLQANPGRWEPWREAMPPASNYQRTIGLVGLSRVGRRVAARLRDFDLEVLACDPFIAPADAARLGVSLVSIDELVRRSQVISLHAPALPETRHLLDARRLAMLPDHATVINTARGSLLDTDALTVECVAGRIDAILDVTDPEPLPAESALYGLPNVQLTPHIAGAMHAETGRLADVALDELARYVRGVPLNYRVHEHELPYIA
jgi:phosphoglycerate dehydrogenase-like enzyme